MRLTLLITLFLILNHSFAQDVTTTVSGPVDVPKTGLDKVVQMRNGNTLLFHFENRKGIIVKVFDSTRHEIASLKHICKVIDINALDRSSMLGLYDINGEAVLFVRQDIDNRETVVRLRFNPTSAKLLSEDKVIQAESYAKPTWAILLKSDDSDSYAFVCAKKNQGFIEQEFTLVEFNGEHKVKRTLPIKVDQKGYDAVQMHSGLIDANNGIMLTVVVSKLMQAPDVYENYAIIKYLAEGKEEFVEKKAQIPQSIWSFRSALTHNPFANTLNMLWSLDNIRQVKDLLIKLDRFGEVKNSTSDAFASYKEQLLLIANDDLSAAKFVYLDNLKILQQLYADIDSSQGFSGNVLKMHTNKFGLSTVVYSGTIQNRSYIGMVGVKGIKKAIGITQYNDHGQEIFGKVVPRSRLKNYDEYPTVFYSNNSQQVLGETCFNNKNSFYVVYNDLDKHLNVKFSDMPDSVYNSDYTNAVYYKLNKKKEVSIGHLLGPSTAGEFKQIYPGSENFDKTTNTLAIVYRHNKGKSVTTNVAWVKFND
jgi:hypothetical protein